MKRREFFKGAGAAGLATAAVASTFPKPALSQGRKQWIAVSAFGKAGLLGQALEEFATFVKQASGGSLSIKVYHAGELVKPFEALDAVQTGSAQMGYGAPYYWTGKSDSISFDPINVEDNFTKTVLFLSWNIDANIAVVSSTSLINLKYRYSPSRPTF